MKNHLNSSKPLIQNKHGRNASQIFGISKFLDGSIRTEPSLNYSFPAITSCCRPQFVKRLNVGDRIVYQTVKIKNLWYIIATLEVVYIAKNHKEAAKWYQNNGVSLPANIMVKENKHVALEKTVGIEGAVGESVEEWDEWYLNRSKEVSQVAICKPIYVNIDNPIGLTKQQYLENFGKIFGTQNPTYLTDEQFNKFNKIRAEK
jgi:hypothetical protein